MAKRFLDTGFYKSPFVRSLQAPYKALYQFMICDCSPAGIWVVDFEAAKMYTGFPVDRAIAEDKFLSTGKAVDIGDGRWFIPGFIRHQYPKGLQAENPAHRNIISELKSYSLITNELELSIQDPSKDLPRPFKGSKDKVMVMEEVKEKEKVNARANKNGTHLHQPMLEAYLAFMTEQDIPPKVEAADHAALKSIRAYLLTITTEDKVCDAWAHLLASHPRWPEWNQTHLRIRDINSQIQNIVSHLKKSKKGKTAEDKHREIWQSDLYKQ